MHLLIFFNKTLTGSCRVIRVALHLSCAQQKKKKKKESFKLYKCTESLCYNVKGEAPRSIPRTFLSLFPILGEI